MATDPVCGMFVDPATTTLRLDRENRTYYFCCEACRDEFAEPTRERRRLATRLLVAWPLAVAVVGLTYLPLGPTAPFLAALGATVVQFYPGSTFYRGTYDAVRDRTWNMDVLIAVGSTAAYGYSAVALLGLGHLPSRTFFDASSLIVTLILTGHYLEQRTRDRAGATVRRLGELVPEHAVVVQAGTERTVTVAEVRVGDRLSVRPGERFPADAQVEEGRTTVDESLLTGEPVPRALGPGDSVLAGSVNGDGRVLARAIGVGADTFLAEVGRLVTEASMSRVPIQRTADRIAAVFVPVVLILALGAAGGWYLLAGAGATTALLIFVTVAVTACPCAFGLATPAALLVGAGRAAEAGALFRGDDALERAARVDCLLVDKTGTLTRGRPTVRRVEPATGATADDVLSAAAAVESGSTHPFARAIREATAARGLTVRPAQEIRAVPGRGLRGTVDGRSVEVVRPDPDDPLPPALEAPLRAASRDGLSAAVVRIGGAPAGLLSFDDPISDGAREAIAALAADGVRVAMVTGDAAAAADRVAAAVGITTVHAGVDPAGKLALVERYRSEGRTVGFVGDGINDAPALTAADLGIAVGTGTAVAREAGQLLLLGSDVRSVPLALRIARRTVAKVRGNLLWALGYNAVLLPIAMGALVPVFGLGLYAALPVAGALAMGLSSTAVLANSLSLRRVRLPAPRPATVGRSASA